MPPAGVKFKIAKHNEVLTYSADTKLRSGFRNNEQVKV